MKIKLYSIKTDGQCGVPFAADSSEHAVSLISKAMLDAPQMIQLALDERMTIVKIGEMDTETGVIESDVIDLGSLANLANICMRTLMRYNSAQAAIYKEITGGDQDGIPQSQ